MDDQRHRSNWINYGQIIQNDLESDGSSRSLLYVSDVSEVVDETDENSVSSTAITSDLSNSSTDIDSILSDHTKSSTKYLGSIRSDQQIIQPSIQRKFFGTSEQKVLDTTKHYEMGENDLEKEKNKMFTQWREEFEAERKAALWQNRMQREISEKLASLARQLKTLRIEAEICIGNLPLTIGAIALSWVMMGIVWFKFTEVALSCTPTSFWSNSCISREFPGCYYCSDDLSSSFLSIAHNFRRACNSFAKVLLFGVSTKFVLAWKIVHDDLSSPVTSTPFGAIAMGVSIVAGGHHGLLGQVLVMSCSLAQVGLFIWFMSMAFKYKMLPDPSWSPNTVSGLCVAAMNVWLY